MATATDQADTKLRSDDPATEDTEPSADSSSVAVAEEATEASADVKTARRLPVTAIGVALLVVAIIAGSVVATFMQLHLRADDAAKDRDAAVVLAARRMVVDLTTLSQGSLDGDMKRIMSETTGSIRDQFSHQADSFRQVVAKGAVESTGQITEAGLISADDNQAQVLVASTSTVKNSDAPNGQQRLYRMKVSLQHLGGTWLVSDVEFVS
ncbi:hypothetical protein [Nocardia nova]|uniref:hypothetical protein n=1 Tax=Nocardia nova TaxID=37330 RepID=UPI000AF414FA|nr:hypothetical protein [Nocardia nova]